MGTKEDIISGRRRRKKNEQAATVSQRTEPNVETRNVMLDEVVVTAPNKQKKQDLGVVETQPYQGKIGKEATPVVSMPAANKEGAKAERRDARIANKAVREEERSSRLADRQKEREKRLAEHAEAVQMRKDARGLERAAKELERSEQRDARLAEKEERREGRQTERDNRKQDRADRYTDKQRERIYGDVFGTEPENGKHKMPKSAVHKDVPVIDSTLENEDPLAAPDNKEDDAATMSQRTERGSSGIDPSQWKVAPKDGETGTVRTDRAKAVKTATVSQPTGQDGGAGESSQQPPKVNSVGSMMDYVDKLAKSMPTKEELEKERKRRKAAAILSAIGDGVSAWANLQATVGGAPSAKHTANLSTAMKERYDKLKEEREKKAKEILEYRMRALASDRQQANADRNFAEGVRRYDTSLENTKKQQAQQQKNWETTRQDGIDQRNQAQENWQKTFDANEAHRKSQTAIQQANAETAKKRAEAYAQRQAANQAGTLRGKKIGFSDGDKNEVAIYENVWKGSKQNVYNAILEDGIKPTSIEQFDMNTPAKVDEWIKKNWTKSPKARAIMLALSDVDPAAVLSQVEGSEDESFEEYAETEDDFEQYAE